ncbi:MAG: peptidylprolyl isomerase [Firmicutes bacterium]|nr:peptidylprolyl isomerase [Bacillota bacterium]MCL2255723.1 peptidylprolyl isomerase [Bacillota bacterium]
MNTIKAQLEFTNGKTINFEMYPDIAPLSVENFVKLAKEGFYDGLCFHRVIPNFMIQGGGFVCEDGKLKQKESQNKIKGEFSSNGIANSLKHEPGVFSMARTMVKDSATSQFFICVAPCSFLDGEYAAFGKATDEESVNLAIQVSKVATGDRQGHGDVPVREVVIKTIRIL